MVDLGFSLYPERYDVTKSKAYIDLCHSYGAKRLFMSLLQLAPADHQMFHCYAELIAYANQLGIRVIADVSPSFISQAGWSDQLIERAHAFGLAGLRLDEALPLAEIVTLTRNPFGLKIELNMSTDKQLLMSLLATDAERSNIIGCHNFYPHEFTGLSWQHFKDMSRFIMSMILKRLLLLPLRQHLKALGYWQKACRQWKTIGTCPLACK